MSSSSSVPSVNKEDIQKKLQTAVKDFQVRGNEFFTNLKSGKFQEEDLRFATLLILGVSGVICMIFPSLVALAFGGGFQGPAQERDWIRLSSIPQLAFALLTFLSQSWESKASKDIIKINAVLFTSYSLLAFVIFLYGSLKFTILITFAVSAFLGFFSAKISGLI